MKNNKKIMAIYCRTATPRQAEKAFSLEAQKKKGIIKAKQLGYEYKLFVEEGPNAAKDDWDNRSQLHELLIACEKGEVSCVFCTEQNRLSRSPIAMAAIKAIFVKHNIILHTTAALIDFKDTEQEFMADLLTLLPNRENTLRGIRSRRALEIAARSGKWIGAVLPFGYRLNEKKIMVVDEEAATVIRKLYRECINGKGTQSIAHGLNQDKADAKIEVKRGSFILTPGKVYNILTNPIYKGERRYKESIIDSPIIIDPEMWELAQVTLKRNKNGADNQLLRDRV